MSRSVSASSLTVSQNLSFGTLIPNNASGQVVISTAGVIAISGGSVSVAPSGTLYYQGVVLFTPTVLDVFTVKVTNSNVILTNSTPGGGTVVVDNFTPNPQTLNITLLSPVKINIGGRMVFSSASKAGVYNGTVQVELDPLLGSTLTINLPITLTLWSPLTMSQTSALSFGGVSVNAGASVVRLGAQNSQRTIISGSGNVRLDNNPAASAGVFSISGQANTSVSITLPTSITLNGNQGGTMTVNNFTASPSATTMTLNATGTGKLFVGADLNIGTSQRSGTYSGTYTITVNY